MDIEQLMPHVEALVFASERPITQIEITEMISQAVELPIEMERISICIEAIKEKYVQEFLTKKEYHRTVLQLNGDKYIKKLSTAAMETLAIVAYKQPITKSEIEYIRGVSADYSIQKLLEKELIVISGRNEDMVGKPLIYATSKNFMDYLGINDPSQLPQLSELSNVEIVVPTAATEALPDDTPGKLIVSEDGELVDPTNTNE
jgi:segregation and condensation protein B